MLFEAVKIIQCQLHFNSLFLLHAKKYVLVYGSLSINFYIILFWFGEGKKIGFANFVQLFYFNAICQDTETLSMFV